MPPKRQKNRQADTLQVLNKKRSPLVEKFNLVNGEVSTLLQAEEKDERQISILMTTGSRIFGEIQTVANAILSHLLENGDPSDEYDREVGIMEDLTDHWTTLNYDVSQAVALATSERRSHSPTPTEISNSGMKRRKGFKRPEMKIKIFDGELKEWLGFWAQFKLIHDEEEMHDSEKFQALVQSMKPGSPAEKVIKPFPQTAENYPKAVAALHERFGNTSVLTSFYIRQLTRLISVNAKSDSRMKVSYIYDEVNAQRQALKSLGLKTDLDPIIYPMVESCLPEDILVAFRRSGLKAKTYEEEFGLLMEFLKMETETEQRLEMGRSDRMQSTVQEDENKMKEAKGGNWKKKGKQSKEEMKSEVATAAELYTGQDLQCVFCSAAHHSHDCGKAQKMTAAEKSKMLESKNACFKCLRVGHMKRKCSVYVSCIVCQGKHQTLMCPKLPQNQNPEPEKSVEVPVNSQTMSVNMTGTVLLQTLIVRAVGNGVTKVIRLLLDTGAQGSHVKSLTAEKLKLEPAGEVIMNKTVFGGQSLGPKRHRKYEVTLESLDGRNRRKLLTVEEAELCGRIPSVPNGPWLKELQKQKITLSDHGAEKVEIEMLIGSDHWGNLMTGKIVKLNHGLVAMETVFGWTLSGPLPHEENVMIMSNTLIVENQMVGVSCTELQKGVKGEEDHQGKEDMKVKGLWELDILGIQDPIEVLTKKEREDEVKRHFAATVKRGEDGRYKVSFPWRAGRQEIPDNRWIAEKRLLNLTEKLKKVNMVEEYHKIFEAWETEGFIRTVRKEDPEPKHYIPHRVVLKPSSKTTPVRPVFDASCKSGRFPSLNECLETGPNLMEMIPAILLRFREKLVALVADIRKAFQMIDTDEEDSRYTCFLWWEDLRCEVIKIFQHMKLMFGMNFCPYVLLAVLEHHLTQVKGEDRETALQLLRSFYADNCVTSVDSVKMYENFRTTAVSLLDEAKMELREWESNVELSSDPEKNVTSVLGLRWDKAKDVMGLAFSAEEAEEEGGKMTKRRILSSLQKIFDPLGFATPGVLQPKILLQKLWKEKIGWDDAIPEELIGGFQAWIKELPELLKIEIPRQLVLHKARLSIHAFADASQAAYAGVIFFRMEDDDGDVFLRFVQAKGRVAPVKEGTIPRLELMGCLVIARLVKSVVEAMEMENVPVFYWSDSTTALAWIRRNDNWGTFVGNRVKEILTLSRQDQWRHVPGVLNPADLPSRGCSPRQLLTSKWWEGPDWLKEDSSRWPNADNEADEKLVAAEKKKSSMAVALAVQVSSFFDPPFSTFLANVRVMGWVRRFISNARSKKEERLGKEFLCLSELRVAERDLMRLIQRESFPCGGKYIIGLTVTREPDKLLHVKTRLVNKVDTELFKKPILLPGDHKLVKMFISDVHRTHGHVGIQCCLGKLRERVWIVTGRRSVKSVIQQCVVCRRQDAKPIRVKSAPLPEKRVTTTQAFQTTGVDLAGPLHLKNGKKVWIVLYTCAVYRGVYLDLVHSLSTEDFIGSLERFVLTHGRPTTLYSDNGTNFVGAQNLFRQLNWEKIEQTSRAKQIRWIFNVPTAAWWGGFWERLVRSTKELLRRILGKAQLDEQKLRNCLLTVAAAINDRPLITLTEDENDLIPLTPQMFMRGLIITDFPEGREIRGKDLQKDFKRTVDLKRQLESRFRKEYLSLLVERGKEKSTPIPKLGDIVLIGAENKKRINWNMGRIVELIEGRDKVFRTARVKTAQGILARPLQRLFPLEVSSDDVNFKGLPIPKVEVPKSGKKKKDPAEKAPVAEIKTRYGRVVKKPQ